MSILTHKNEGDIAPPAAEVSIPGVSAELTAATDLATRILAQKFTICRFNSSKDNLPKPASLTLAEICEEFRQHPVRKQKDGAAWSPVSYIPGGTRKRDSVEFVHMAVLDVDNGTPFEALQDLLAGFTYLAHSSFSHKPEHHKYRIIVPLADPVPASEWDIVWARFNQFAGGINDPATKDASRLYFTPGHPIDTDYHFVKEGQGKLLTLADLPEVNLPVKSVSVSPVHGKSSGKSNAIDQWDTTLPDLGFEQGLTEVVNRCAFMKFASAPDKQPHVDEPLWQAMISNACRFENSDEWIHTASEQHPEYNEAATDKKIARALNGSAPITCQRIRELGFNGCPGGGCRRPNGLVTKAPAGLSGWLFQIQLTAEQGTTATIPEEYQVGDFWVRPEGVFQSRYDKKNKETFEVRICSRIDVTAQTRDDSSVNWGMELSFKDPDEVAKTWALPRELLASNGDSYRASLLRMGATIEPSKEAKDGLASYLSAAVPPARALSVRQPGWFNDVFVLPDAIYGQTNQRVVYETKDPEDLLRFAKVGSLQSWQEQVAAIAQGNSRVVLSLCAGLAAPLLKLLDEPNGGFHLRGNSSCGKTICLTAGSSVWGGENLIRTWNTTVNGLEGVATMHNDVLLPLDELGQADAKAAGEAAYMLGNGQGKSRANRDGDARVVKRFRNIVLSSGEKSLSDVMASIGQTAMAGQEVRIVEIPADAGRGFGAFENIHGSKTSQEFAERLKMAVTENFGHAGRALVEILANPELQPKLIERVKATIKRFVDTYVPEGSVGQVSRVGHRFGLVAGAGELGIELGILPWPEGEAIDACRKCFMAWIEQRGGIGNHEAEQAVATVRRFLELHGESRFTLWVKSGNVDATNDLDARFKTISRVGFRCVTGDGRYEYYILPEAYNTEMCRGLNPTGVTKELVKRGFLHTNSVGKAQIDVRLPGIGKKKVYHLNPDIMGDVVVSQVDKVGDTWETELFPGTPLK